MAGIREPGLTRGGHYQTSATIGNKTGTFFNRHPDGNVDKRTDVYYVQTVDLGKTWTAVDGQQLTIPLEHIDTPARVIDYASQSVNVYVKDMGFCEQGHPVLLYVTSQGHEPGPPNDDTGSLYLDGQTWIAIIPSTRGPQPYHGGGEVAYWESSDRGSSWQ